MPEDWCADLTRRRTAHIPDTLTFATKPELAKRMVQHVQAAGLPICWVVADTVYGHCPDLRDFLEEQDHAYATFGPFHRSRVCADPHRPPAEPLWPALRSRRCVPAIGSATRRARAPKASASDASGSLARGARGAVDGRHWLVMRRCLDDPHELAYYLVWAPLDTPLPIMVQAIGARWHVEEDLQACKGLGLDHSEVRSYLGWYRHITLVLLAYAFLVSVCAQAQGSLPAPAPSSVALPQPTLIALTPSEVRHLLAHLLWPAPISAPLVCQWSRFRRTHQYWAGYYHRRRRAKAG